MVTEAVAGLVLLPLLAACAVAALPRRAIGAFVVIGLLPLPLFLVPITESVWRDGAVTIAVAGFESPLGIMWHADPLALCLLWLIAVVGTLVAFSAMPAYPPAGDRGRRFWTLWLLLVCAMNALVLSADLFNIFVTLELVTLSAIGLLVIDGKPAALRAAMRYLLLALLGSLFYLFGVALVYGQAGTLDIGQAAERLGTTLLPVTALILMTVGLLVKSAIFPLHGWLPAAHGNAPAPVSAVLSALVVKVSIYVIWRLWLWMAADWQTDWSLALLGLLGAGAIVYGSVLAFLQVRLKMMVAYSTVAQLGYLMLVFPLSGALGFTAATYHLLSHGFAKAAMFIAAGNIALAVGTDRLDRLAGVDRRAPLAVFTLAIAGVSIIGLPPSGGFVAKWLLLQAAWSIDGWLWFIVILLGGLLAAAYLFRALSAMCARPAAPIVDAASTTSAHGVRWAGILALLLALSALAAGLMPAPVLDLLDRGLPPGISSEIHPGSATDLQPAGDRP